MSTPADAVREQAEVVAKSTGATRNQAERELLTRLGRAMKSEESSFDAAHGSARVMDATDAHHEVRLKLDGSWTLGAAPEEDLVATWGSAGRPPLRDLLAAIRKTFSSAKIDALVAAVEKTLG